VVLVLLMKLAMPAGSRTRSQQGTWRWLAGAAVANLLVMIIAWFVSPVVVPAAASMAGCSPPMLITRWQYRAYISLAAAAVTAAAAVVALRRTAPRAGG